MEAFSQTVTSIGNSIAGNAETANAVLHSFTPILIKFAIAIFFLSFGLVKKALRIGKFMLVIGALFFLYNLLQMYF